MPICIVLRHVHHEGLGLFEAPLRERGYAVRYVDAPVEPLDAAALVAADLLVVMGGPVGAYEGDRFPWLLRELDALRTRLAAGRPVLGVCLGAQLVAAALGASVAPGPAPEIGWAPVAFTEAGRASPLGVLEGLPVLHWHGDRFELPAGAVGLASTPLCPHQAFALGAHVLALQFHPEVDPDAIEPWLVADSAELARSGIEPERLRRDTATHGPAMRTAAPALLAAWLDGLDRRQDQRRSAVS